MTETTLPPRWDLATLFSTLDSAEFQEALSAYLADLDAVAALHAQHNVHRRNSPEVDANFAAAFETILATWNRLLVNVRLLTTYVSCITTTDANNNEARAVLSLINGYSVRQEILYTRFVAWVGTSDIDALARESAAAREHLFFLKKSAYQAQHQMSEGEEELASELRTSGLIGWSRLHGSMSALLEVSVPLPTGTESLPMSAVRSLANHADREVRRVAFEAETKAWESVSVPFAAAINGIKGFQLSVRKRRGYTDDVEPTLAANSIDRQTLDAMLEAVVESLPDFERFLRTKARALGLEKLAWYDLNAPVAAANTRYSWPEAERFIVENFGRFSARMAEFAEHSFRSRWVDAEPRVGKEGGAYCASPLPGISRIMMNFDGSFNSVSTLAHELGHAYHNLNLKDRTALQRGTPSTLAETASIFCETLVFEAAAKSFAPTDRLALLDTVMERNVGVVVDIYSRYLLEKGVFERRASRDLTVPELNSLMIASQRTAYGDAVEPLHPYMWAVKGHYYGPTLYNYPYTFGLLFGLGLYSEYEKSPADFRMRYDELLSSTGLADAATLADRFGFDTRRPDFWRSSLDVIRKHIAEFARLAADPAGLGES